MKVTHISKLHKKIFSLFFCTQSYLEGGDIMGMTNKQFQGFLRLSLSLLKKAFEKNPENESLQELIDIFQSMLEDS